MTLIAFGGLAQITPDSSTASLRTSWEALVLLLVSLILFVALTSLLAVGLRRAFSEPTHAHRRSRPLVPSEWGLGRGIDPDAPADSVSHPPAK